MVFVAVPMTFDHLQFQTLSLSLHCVCYLIVGCMCIPCGVCTQLVKGSVQCMVQSSLPLTSAFSVIMPTACSLFPTC